MEIRLDDKDGFGLTEASRNTLKDHFPKLTTNGLLVMGDIMNRGTELPDRADGAVA
jgi:hypothetical protein